MEMLESFTGTRKYLFFLLLFLLLFGAFTIITGIKMQQTNKRASTLTITLGVLFSLFILFLMLFVLFFGFNF